MQSRRCPEHGSSLAHVILTALAKDPAERFQSARQFRDALESLIVMPSPAVPETAETAPESPSPGRAEMGLRKLVLTGVVTFLVMLAIFLFFSKLASCDLPGWPRLSAHTRLSS